MYKYELHLHTCETSRCGQVPAKEQVRIYKEMGYDGIAVTDHFHPTYIDSLDCRDDWNKVVDEYVLGYNEAKKAGDELGMNVIFGLELRFPEDDRDYLTFGVDENWLRNHPYCCMMSHQQFFDAYKDELLFIQAHPFRVYNEADPEHVHGVEVVNCNPRHDSRNERALALAKEHPGFLVSCGSDAHRDGDQGHGAVLFEKAIRDTYELREEMQAGRYELWCPEFQNIIDETKGIIHHV